MIDKSLDGFQTIGTVDPILDGQQPFLNRSQWRQQLQPNKTSATTAISVNENYGDDNNPEVDDRTMERSSRRPAPRSVVEEIKYFSWFQIYSPTFICNLIIIGINFLF